MINKVIRENVQSKMKSCVKLSQPASQQQACSESVPQKRSCVFKVLFIIIPFL